MAVLGEYLPQRFMTELRKDAPGMDARLANLERGTRLRRTQQPYVWNLGFRLQNEKLWFDRNQSPRRQFTQNILCWGSTHPRPTHWKEKAT